MMSQLMSGRRSSPSARFEEQLGEDRRGFRSHPFESQAILVSGAEGLDALAS